MIKTPSVKIHRLAEMFNSGIYLRIRIGTPSDAPETRILLSVSAMRLRPKSDQALLENKYVASRLGDVNSFIRFFRGYSTYIQHLGIKDCGCHTMTHIKMLWERLGQSTSQWDHILHAIFFLFQNTHTHMRVSKHIGRPSLSIANDL